MELDPFVITALTSDVVAVGSARATGVSTATSKVRLGETSERRRRESSQNKYSFYLFDVKVIKRHFRSGAFSLKKTKMVSE